MYSVGYYVDNIFIPFVYSTLSNKASKHPKRHEAMK